jgi:hypothetical protein
MSAKGSYTDMTGEFAMSALPPKADIVQHGGNVRFVPGPDSCGAASSFLFDHLVSAQQGRGRHRDAERLGSLEIDDQLELSRLLHW